MGNPALRALSQHIPPIQIGKSAFSARPAFQKNRVSGDLKRLMRLDKRTVVWAIRLSAPYHSTSRLYRSGRARFQARPAFQKNRISVDLNPLIRPDKRTAVWAIQLSAPYRSTSRLYRSGKARFSARPAFQKNRVSGDLKLLIRLDKCNVRGMAIRLSAPYRSTSRLYRSGRARF